MSWSETFGPVQRDAVAEYEPHNEATRQSLDQFEQARAAAVAIIDAGVVGAPDDHRFYVTLGGHANPGHEVQDGYARDGLSLNVTQAASNAPPPQA
jgi:hypothetical protein